MNRHYPFHSINTDMLPASDMTLVDHAEDYAARLARMLPPEPLTKGEERMLENEYERQTAAYEFDLY